MRSTLFTLIVLTSCAVDDPPEEEGTVEQAFTGITTASIGGLTMTHQDLGPFSNRTCFLTSVSGSLEGSSLVSVHRDSNDHWGFVVDPHEGHALYATAACVGSVAGRTDFGFWLPTTNDDLLTTDPEARCFLTSINVGPHDFESLSDNVMVYQNASGHWYIGGNGHAAGEAICISAAKRGNGGSLSGATAVILSPALTGDQCGLTALGGRFRSESSTDGVSTYRDTVNNRWMLSAGSQKLARARCAR